MTINQPLAAILLVGCFVLAGCDEPFPDPGKAAKITPEPTQSPASVTVIIPATGPALIASPNPLPVTVQHSGSTTIAWNTGGGVGEVYLGRDADQRLFARGVKGSKAAPWIKEGIDYEFRLYKEGDRSNVLSQLTVKKLGAEPAPASAH